jgi:hypothetical protein
MPMALPIAPIAGVALRYGAVALAAYALSRQVTRGRIDQRAEDAMDELPEGITAQRPRDRDQVNGTLRLRRVIRLGADGPGFEVDATAFGRIRFRRV